MHQPLVSIQKIIQVHRYKMNPRITLCSKNWRNETSHNTKLMHFIWLKQFYFEKRAKCK